MVVPLQILEWESAESNLRASSFSSLDKMLNRSDIDLNSVQGCMDSLKEGLKQTMLDQELAFMKQVYELHRLYRIQVAMMEDLKQNGSDNYRLHRGSMNSISVNMNNQGKCSLAGFKQSANSYLQHEWVRLPVFMQKPLDLQLPADEFISYSANDILGEGIRRGSLQHSIGSRNFSQGERVFGLDKLILSLGIGHDPSKNGEHINWMEKKTYASASNVIDLEDPEFCYLDNDVSPGFASGLPATNMYAKEKRKLESLSQSGMRDLSYGAPLSVVDIGSSSHRQASCDSGFVGSSTYAGHDGKHKEFLSADFSSKNQKPAVCKGNNLDLNIVQHEETSYSSNNHSMVLNFSPACFPNLSKKVCPNPIIAPLVTPTCRKDNVSQRSETSEKHQKREMDLNLAVSHRKTDRGKSCKDGGKVNFIDLDSDPEEELCSGRSNPKIESVGLSKLSNGQSCNKDVIDAVGVEVRVERDAEPPVSSYSSQSQTATEPPNHQKLSSTLDSDCIIDHQLSSIKTVQSGVVSGDVNFSTSEKSLKVKSGDPDAHLAEQDQGSSNSTESKIQSIVRNEPKVDEAVQAVAELLVQISSEAQACGSIELASKEFRNEDDQPQCSIESYEAMVLKAKECGLDDLCVSSNAFMVDESEKEIRYKLKRGTRMKDFQKDILPGLSILSRHEIREDINIMEGVIRSREYKRMRARMGDGDEWCKPTRSKRSRVSYSRRYYH